MRKRNEVFIKTLLSLLLLLIVAGGSLGAWRCAFGHWELSKPNFFYVLKFTSVTYLFCLLVFVLINIKSLVKKWLFSFVLGVLAIIAFYFHLIIGLSI